MIRSLLAALLALGLALAQEQICRPELERAAALAGPRPGLRAAALIHRAHQLIEPAFPRLERVQVAALPLARHEHGFESLRYLAERRLLPEGWLRDELDAATWQAMIDALMRGYGFEPTPVTVPISQASLTDDTALALARLADVIRPAAVVAFERQDRTALTFMAYIWNWTPRPRLLVLNPSDLSLADGVEALLEQAGTCALQARSYVLARDDLAIRLFLGSGSTTFRIVGSEPDRRGDWPLRVAAGSEVEALSYRDSALVELNTISISFEGPVSSGFLNTVSLALQVRTNMSLNRFLNHLEFPPRP